MYLRELLNGNTSTSYVVLNGNIDSVINALPYYAFTSGILYNDTAKDLRFQIYFSNVKTHHSFFLN